MLSSQRTELSLSGWVLIALFIVAVGVAIDIVAGLFGVAGL